MKPKRKGTLEASLSDFICPIKSSEADQGEVFVFSGGKVAWCLLLWCQVSIMWATRSCGHKEVRPE